MVIPILKEGDHEVANNNRPVSLLPALSKICARVDLGAGPAVPNLCSLKSYVDDSQFYLTFPVQETAMAVEHLSEDLQQIAAWCCTHSLLINPDKTKLLLLGTPEMLARVPKGFGVTLLSKEILPSCSAKDLGVMEDSHLSFDEHVAEVVSKCIGRGGGHLTHVWV